MVFLILLQQVEVSFSAVKFREEKVGCGVGHKKKKTEKQRMFP